jgi:hypothetical protein
LCSSNKGRYLEPIKRRSKRPRRLNSRPSMPYPVRLSPCCILPIGQGSRLMSTPSQLRCREITPDDIERVINLLTQGFNSSRTREHWVMAMRILTEHPTPPGLPKYGYVLVNGDDLVGVLLLIFSSLVVDFAIRIRCGVSSWYVKPEFRSYAQLLALRTTSYKNVAYVNISPSPHTWPILVAQGYSRFSAGIFASVPALRRSSPACPVGPIDASTQPGKDLQRFEIELLSSHAGYGCISLICHAADGRHPFVFRRRFMYGVVPVAHLIYCRDLTDFVGCARSLGRYLIRHGILFVDIDANGPIQRLIGVYRDGRPKYCKGSELERLGDLAYSEIAMFGF